MRKPFRRLFKLARFDTAQQGQVHAFVNLDFGFHDPEYADLAHMFWRQVGWMKAESYLADNDYLIFVSENSEVSARVYEALRQIR